MTTMTLRDPFTAPFRLLDELLAGWSDRAVTGFVPPVDVRETDDEYLVMVDLPGVKPADVTIEVSGGMLTISGSRVAVEKGEARLTQRPYGSFTRTLTLPEGVDEDAIAAEYHDGVLELHIPRPAERRRKKIAIASGAGSAEQKAIAA